MFVMTSPTCVMVAAPPQLSDEVTLPVFTAGTSGAHETVTFGGQVIVGGVLSNTVIVCIQVDELLHASVALYVLVTVYRLIHVMLATTSPTCVTVTGPQLSVAVTAPVLTAGSWLAHCTVTFAGQVIVGGLLSSTVIV